jgi:Cu-Zn family superoxide dismutase
MQGMHCTRRPAQVVANATLMLANGASAGTAELLQGPDGYRVHVDAKGLTPGVHGIHLHTGASARCARLHHRRRPPQPRRPSARRGNPAGAHLGDLTNLTVGPDGTGALDFALPWRRT